MRNSLCIVASAVFGICFAPFGMSAQAHGPNVEFITICHFPPGSPGNPRTITVSENALDAHLAHGDHVGECGAEPFPPFVVNATTDRSYGTIATVFQFDAMVLSESDTEIADFHWETGDGRTFSGPEISLTFDTHGFHQILLTATSVSGHVETTEVGVVVHADGRLAPEALAIPEPFGDTSGDGNLTLLDVHQAAKFAGHLSPLPDQRARLAADMDFSGRVTFDDVELIAQAVLSDQPLPDRLLSASGPPGSVVTLVSHHLLDPGDFIEISVGDDNQWQTVDRPVLGYATFIMPLTEAAAEPGEQEILLLVNGSEVSDYRFTVMPPADLPDDPVAELGAVLDDLQALLAINESLILDQLDRYPLTEGSHDAFVAAAAGGRLEVSEIVDELQALLATSEGEALAATFFEAANANGLPELRAQLEGFLQAAQDQQSGTFTPLTISPDAVCDELLPALCAVKRASELVDQASGVISTSCDVMLVTGLGGTITGVLTKPSAAALFLWAKVCAPLELALDVAGTVTDLISHLDPDLHTEVANPNAASGEIAILTAQLRIADLKLFCDIGGSQGTERLVDILSERAVNRMIQRKITVRAMKRVFTFLGESMLQHFLGLLQSGAGKVITSTGVDQAILEFATPYCADYFGADLVMNASRVMSGPQPNVGSLNFRADGRAEYTCPENPESVPEEGVQFEFEKQMCEDSASRTETVNCGKVREVIITMGDNGALNDDIFEVLLDGQSVLTSSVPVRSTSVTVQLPADSTAQVQMLGRAAPDGIGTYFITFSGATIIAGDATSGSDLVPGTVKTFTIQVAQ